MKMRDQVLRDALQTIANLLEPGKIKEGAAGRARDVAVKTLYVTKAPDPLARVAGEMLIVLGQVTDELRAAQKAAAAGEPWSFGQVEVLAKVAIATIDGARQVGVRVSGVAGGSPEIMPEGPL